MYTHSYGKKDVQKFMKRIKQNPETSTSRRPIKEI